jgi:nuclear protein localization protein 4 homolog
MIFTDLTDDGTGQGTVVCKRHINSYYLSSTDVYQASLFQNIHKSPSKWSETGFFGSKFVTCVISGDENGNIAVTAYQASNTAMAMVEADIITPSTDPGVMLVNKEAPGRYIPEVFYRRINEYGANVQENAKPAFPVDYLLITLTHGFRTDGEVMFSASKEGVPFPVENRQIIGVVQEVKDIATQVGVSGKQSETRGLFAVSDFHLLTYLYGLGVLVEVNQSLSRLMYRMTGRFLSKLRRRGRLRMG